MSIEKDLAAAKKAQRRLNAYVKGLPKNSPETPMYLKLNADVNRAVKKLPIGMRIYILVDMLG